MASSDLGATIASGAGVGAFFSAVLFFIRRADRVTNARLEELLADRDYWRARALGLIDHPPAGELEADE